MRALIAGASGFVGRRLASALVASGADVLGLVRDRGRSSALEHAGLELHEGDVLDAESLAGAGRDVDVAYYLVHSMGRGGDGDFAERERRAARNFARMVAEEGVARVVYLGGLGGDRATSRHLPQPPRDGRDPALGGSAADLLPSGDGGRRRERVLPDAAPPREAPPGHARSELARHPDSADRDRRRGLPIFARHRRSTSRRDARWRSEALRSSPMARCSTAWPRRSEYAPGRSCAYRSSPRGSRRCGSAS